MGNNFYKMYSFVGGVIHIPFLLPGQCGRVFFYGAFILLATSTFNAIISIYWKKGVVLWH